MNDALRNHLRQYALAVHNCPDCSQELCDVHAIERDYLNSKLQEAHNNATNHN